jgi:5-methylcytosine-specific restriction endonuclease McrA
MCNKGLRGYMAGEKHWSWNKKRPDMQGENNPNWKGGASKETRYNNEYRIWRSRVFTRDNYVCQICDNTGVYVQADHIKPYADYPELRYDISNGRTLCVPCHYYVTFKKKMPKGIVWGTNKRISKL